MTLTIHPPSQIPKSVAQTLTPLTGATAGTNGTVGLVPQPLAGQQALFLRGDGTWAAAGGGGGGGVVTIDGAAVGADAAFAAAFVDPTIAIIRVYNTLNLDAVVPLSMFPLDTKQLEIIGGLQHLTAGDMLVVSAGNMLHVDLPGVIDLGAAAVNNFIACTGGKVTVDGAGVFAPGSITKGPGGPGPVGTGVFQGDVSQIELANLNINVSDWGVTPDEVFLGALNESAMLQRAVNVQVVDSNFFAAVEIIDCNNNLQSTQIWAYRVYNSRLSRSAAVPFGTVFGEKWFACPNGVGQHRDRVLRGVHFTATVDVSTGNSELLVSFPIDDSNNAYVIEQISFTLLDTGAPVSTTYTISFDDFTGATTPSRGSVNGIRFTSNSTPAALATIRLAFGSAVDIGGIETGPVSNPLQEVSAIVLRGRFHDSTLSASFITLLADSLAPELAIIENVVFRSDVGITSTVSLSVANMLMCTVNGDPVAGMSFNISTGSVSPSAQVTIGNNRFERGSLVFSGGVRELVWTGNLLTGGAATPLIVVGWNKATVLGNITQTPSTSTVGWAGTLLPALPSAFNINYLP